MSRTTGNSTTGKHTASYIVLEQVTKRFGDAVAVDNLSLEISRGQFFSMLGPSGCGKTTTMRLIAGLEKPDSGRIWIADTLVYDAADDTFVPPGRRGLGMVFQSYALWPHMTVEDNIRFGLKVRRVAKNEQNKRLASILERLQISELAERYPSELSGGQQQRVALARELVTGTELLLMDEPLSNLDAKLRVDMRVELKQLHEEMGTTIIYVTHDQIEALTLSSRMAIMKQGHLRQVDAPYTVFSQPADLFVAQFMGDVPINVAEVQCSPAHMLVAGERLPLPDKLEINTARTLTLATRPEELSLQKTADTWTLPVVVISILPMGHNALVRVSTLADELQLTVAVDLRKQSFTPREECFVRFQPETLLFFDPTSGKRVLEAAVPA